MRNIIYMREKVLFYTLCISFCRQKN